MIAAAQFSVHRTPSRNAVRPFVIVLQSDEFARMPTPVVAPLVRPHAMPQLGSEQARVAPRLVVKGQGSVLNPFDLATLRRRIQDALNSILKPF